MNYVYFILLLFLLSLEFFFLICVILMPNRLSGFGQFGGSPAYDERRRIRVRKCEQSGKSMSHLPPK